MIIKTDKLKEKCNVILAAVDANELSVLTETLELKTEGTNLVMSVTNREYFVKIKLDINQVENFKATVNANLFLKLISQITTPDIELTVNTNNLLVKGNGVYKLPLIFDNDQLLELPEININNPTLDMNIDSNILNSILIYNSKELTRGTISKPVQKLFYVDEFGAITFTSGACVNTFDLQKPVKLLLGARIVKLFKLFQNSTVKFTLGYDNISDSIIQTKVRFETNDIELTAITGCDDTLLKSVPVNAIRSRANAIYDYNVSVDKDALLQTINRLLLFASVNGKDSLKPYSNFEFTNDYIRIWDVNKDNNEDVKYNNASNIQTTYTTVLDLVDLKTVLENCSEKYINLSFGDHQALIVSRGNIKNVVPEIHLV